MPGEQPISVFEKLRCHFDVVFFHVIFCCLVRQSRCLFVFPSSIPEMEQEQEQSQASSTKTQAQLRIEKSQVVLLLTQVTHIHTHDTIRSQQQQQQQWFSPPPILTVSRSNLRKKTTHHDFLDFSMQHSPGNLLMWWTPIEMPKLNIENVVKLVFNGNLKSVRNPRISLSLCCLDIVLCRRHSSSCIYRYPPPPLLLVSCILFWKNSVNWWLIIILLNEIISKQVKNDWKYSSNWVSATTAAVDRRRFSLVDIVAFYVVRFFAFML